MNSNSIIINYLKKSTLEFVKSSVIAKETGLSVRTVQRVIKKLTADGLVTKVGRGTYKVLLYTGMRSEISENDIYKYNTNKQTNYSECQNDSEHDTKSDIADVLEITPQRRAEYEKRRRHLWALAASIQEIMGVDGARKEAIYRLLFRFFQEDWELLSYVNTFAVSYAVNVTLKAVGDKSRFVRNPLAYCVGVLKNVALQNRDRFVLERQAVAVVGGEEQAVEEATEAVAVSAEEAAVSADLEAVEASVSQDTVCVSAEARGLAENIADMLLQKGMTWYCKENIRERLGKCVQMLMCKGMTESDIYLMLNKIFSDSVLAAGIRIMPEVLLTMLERDWYDEQSEYATEQSEKDE